MSTIKEIDFAPVLEKFKATVREAFPHITDIRQYKGQGRREGWIKVSLGIGHNQRMDIHFNVNRMLTEKDYMNGIYDNINDCMEHHAEYRFNKMRIGDGFITCQ